MSAPAPAHPSAASAAGVRSLPKGQQTRAAIVEAAMSMASQLGLEGLSIGTLADVTGRSKSGVFAHFGSRDDLQIAVVEAYYERFQASVFAPAMRQPRGLPRVRTLFENWMRHTSTEPDSGCIFISGAVEFDDRPGPVRDALKQAVQTWMDALTRAVAQAVEEGHLRAEVDPQQIVFEIHALILALHYEARFLRRAGSVQRARQGFEQLIARDSA